MYCAKCGADMGEKNVCDVCGVDAGCGKKTIVGFVEKYAHYFKSGKIFMAIFFVLFVVIGIVVVKNHKVKVDLDEFVYVDFSGYDTVGRAKGRFDYEAFEEKYGDKICLDKDAVKEYLEANDEKWSSKEVQEYIEQLNACRALYTYCVQGALDKQSDLKNGDAVVYSWQCEDAVATEYFNVKLKYSEIEFGVDKLKEVEEIDPFQCVVIDYLGISPNGRANLKVETSEEIYDDISYEIEPSKELENGEVLIVTANTSMPEEMFIEKYGKKITENKKSYTVDGLAEYVNDISDISDEEKNRIKEHAKGILETFVNNQCKKNDESDWIRGNVEKIEFVNDYLLVKKGTSEYQENNIYYCLYEVNVTEKVKMHATGEFSSHNFSYYVGVKYCDLISTENGCIEVDLSLYNIVKDEFVHDSGLFYVRWGKKTDKKILFEYGGYDTEEKFVEENVKKVQANYDLAN